MSAVADRLLFLCYGNPGRLDDGLGAAFAEAFEAPEGVDVEADYQLAIEDAEALSRYRQVVFVDAAASGAEPFGFDRVDTGGAMLSFSSHSVSPAALLALAHRLFGAETQGYTLAIRGYEFDDFGERLSAGARRNLRAALDFAARLAAPIADAEGAEQPGGGFPCETART